MYLCSYMLNSNDWQRDTLQTEASMILNYMVWEHAVFVGVLTVLHLLKVGDRYTALLILEHTSPERTFQTYSSRLV